MTITWDDFGVPHVAGATGTDVAYGAGWATGGARLLIAELIRTLGRGGQLELSGRGGGLFDVLGTLETGPRIGYTDAELLAQVDLLVATANAREPGRGDAIRAELQAYVDGLNDWIAENPPLGRELAAIGVGVPEPWTVADVVASAITVGDLFGTGGGDEVGNAVALQALVDELGEDAGLATYEDLRSRDRPEATPHVDATFPYPLFAPPGGTPRPGTAADADAVALPDPGSVSALGGSGDGRAAQTAAQTAAPASASNYAVLAGSRTSSGRPALLGGPQAAYLYPEIPFELELSGGGFAAAGISFPGTGPYIAIGYAASRAGGYTWTATAGGSDLVDQRVERLCDPSGGPVASRAEHYVFDGECVAMTRPGGAPPAVPRTVHGPVTAYATVDGDPVAISRQRASRGREAVSVLAFRALSRGEVDDAGELARVMADVPFTFNWAYTNATDVAYFHSGRYPVRAPGVSFDLPTWGTGEWEWTGFLDRAAHPQVVDPSGGVLVSWNNHVAPGWSEADDSWGVGVAQRVDPLLDRVDALRGASDADLVEAVQDAATVDLRGDAVVAELLAVLDGSAPSAELRRARGVLRAWVEQGAHRRDREPDWIYDEAGVALVDELFANLVPALFEPQLGSFFADGVRRPATIDDAPSPIGSAFNTGWYSLVVRELRRVQGEEPRPGDVPTFCGSDLNSCRQLLWDVLGQTYTEVEATQPFWSQWNVRWWREWAGDERITFPPYVFNPNSMRWVNRPTYQQLVSF